MSNKFPTPKNGTRWMCRVSNGNESPKFPPIFFLGGISRWYMQERHVSVLLLGRNTETFQIEANLWIFFREKIHDNKSPNILSLTTKNQLFQYQISLCMSNSGWVSGCCAVAAEFRKNLHHLYTLAGCGDQSCLQFGRFDANGRH